MREITGTPVGVVEEGTFIHYHNWEAVGYAQPTVGDRITLPILSMIVDTQGMKLFDFMQAVSNLTDLNKALTVEFIRHWNPEKKNMAAWWRFKEVPKLL